MWVQTRFGAKISDIVGYETGIRMARGGVVKLERDTRTDTRALMVWWAQIESFFGALRGSFVKLQVARCFGCFLMVLVIPRGSHSTGSRLDETLRLLLALLQICKSSA